MPGHFDKLQSGSVLERVPPQTATLQSSDFQVLSSIALHSSVHLLDTLSSAYYLFPQWKGPQKLLENYKVTKFPSECPA